MRRPYKLLSSDSCYSIDFRSYTSFQAESAVKDILDSGGNKERVQCTLHMGTMGDLAVREHFPAKCAEITAMNLSWRSN